MLCAPSSLFDPQLCLDTQPLHHSLGLEPSELLRPLALSGGSFLLPPPRSLSDLLPFLFSSFLLALLHGKTIHCFVASDSTLFALAPPAQALAQALGVQLNVLSSRKSHSGSLDAQIVLAHISQLAQHIRLLEHADQGFLPLPDVLVLLEADACVPLLQRDLGFKLPLANVRALAKDLRQLQQPKLALRLTASLAQLESVLLASYPSEGLSVEPLISRLQPLILTLDHCYQTFLAAAPSLQQPVLDSVALDSAIGSDLVPFVRAQRCRRIISELALLLESPLDFSLSAQLSQHAITLHARLKHVGPPLLNGLFLQVPSILLLPSETAPPSQYAAVLQALGLNQALILNEAQCLYTCLHAQEVLHDC